MNGFKRMQGLSSKRELYTFVDEIRREEGGSSQGILGLQVTRVLQSCGEAATGCRQNLGPVSRKSGKLFGPEEPFVKLRPALIFFKAGLFICCKGMDN